MHDSRFYKKEKKHEVAIYENKHARGRPKGKGYTIATEFDEKLFVATKPTKDSTNVVRKYKFCGEY